MRIRKQVFMVFILFGTLSGLCAFAKGDAVIGDSTFSTDIGEVHYYNLTYSTLSMRKVGDMEKFSTPAIYADVHEGKDSMIVNFTAKYYNSTSKTWTSQNNNEFYCAYNYSQWYLNASYAFSWGNAFFIPLPINLTMVCLAVNNSGNLNASIKGLKEITMTNTAMQKVINLTYNDEGIATKFVNMDGGATSLIWEHTTPPNGNGGDTPPEDPPLISYGLYFLIYMTATISLILFMRKRRDILPIKLK